MKVENCKLGVEAHFGDASLCMCRCTLRRILLALNKLKLCSYKSGDIPDDLLSDYIHACNINNKGRQCLPACKFYDTHK